MSPLLVAAARTVPLFQLLPFGPRTVRLVVALAVAVVVAPAAASPSAETVATQIPLLVAETLSGIALGLVGAALFLGASAAGALVDEARQPALRRIPRDGAFRRLQLFFALAIFAAAGGPSLACAAVAETYLALPPGHALSALDAVAIASVARLLASAVALSAPLLAAVLLAEVAVGLVERAAPALARVAAPGPAAGTLRGLAAVLVLALTAATGAILLDGGAHTIASDLEGAARALGGR